MPYDETTKYSKYSPEIIKNSEEISRVIFSPKHYDDGKILPTAFYQILDPNGMSVLRQNHDFDNCLEKTIKLLENNGTNEYIGYVSANVANIRKIIIETYRIFYILDTSTKDRIGHADIFAERPSLPNMSNKLVKNLIRFKIANVFNKITHAKS